MSLYRYHMISIFTQTGDELSRNRHESHISTILLLLLYYFIYLNNVFKQRVAQLSFKASLHVVLYKTIEIFPKHAVGIKKIQYILTYVHLKRQLMFH